jgi:diguanylate cyclase (GGDEF)-like protein/PAS domain S-box-containing protein
MSMPARLWRRLTDAPAAITDSAHRCRIQLLLGLLVVLVPLGLFSISIQILLIPGFWPTFKAVASALVLLAAAYGLGRTGRYAAAALITVGVSTAASFAVVIFNPADVMAHAFLSVSLLLAGLLFGYAGVWGTLLTCLLGEIVLLPALGVPPPNGDPVVAPMFLTITAALLLLGIRQRDAVERERHVRIEESEARLRSIAAATSDGIFILDQGRILDVNDHGSRMLGLPREELIGRSVLEFCDPAYRDIVTEHALSGSEEPYEALGRRADGTTFWGEIHGRQLLYAGKPARVVVLRDLTEQRKTEQALRDSERYLRAIISNAPVVLYTLDRDGVIGLSEGKGLAALGLKPGEVVGRSVFEMYRDYPGICANIRRALAGEPVVYVTTLGAATFEAHYSPILGPDGRLETVIGLAIDITERQRAEQALIQSESNFRTLTENANVGIFVNQNGRHVFANPRALQMLGYTFEEIRHTGIKEVVHPDEYEKVMQRSSDRRAGRPAPSVYETVFVTKDGRPVPVEITPTVTTWQGEPAGLVFVLDLRERKQAEDMRRRLGRILDDSSNEIYVFDAETLHFVQVNRGARENLGYTMEELRRLTPLDLKPDYTAEDFAALVAPLRDGSRDAIAFETVHRRKDGSRYPVEVRLHLSRTETPPVFVAIIQDITERMQARERLQYLAQHDALTELPNRLLLLDRLKQSLARARWQQRLVGVLFIDLDRFKTINDTLGHEAGDRLLQQLGDRFSRCVREGDTVARFGGDEFVILLDDVASGKDVGMVAQKVLDTLAAPFAIDDQNLYISASIGVSLFPGDGEDTGTLLKNADVAMYRAKELGKNTYQFYSADMTARAFERLSLETSLRHALERNEFVLHYQPQIVVDSGEIIGVEALIRWQHPDFGLVAPAEFIPLLEETGLILPVGEWVLQNACQQLHAWHADGWHKLRMAVNLSPRQVQAPGLAAMIARALEIFHGDPGWLELEITESLLVKHATATLEALKAVRALGVRLAVDDFGTGYSALAYLRRFPIDTLKIDRSFVHDIPGDPDDSAITTAIVAMAQSLRLEAVAEGVENEAQRDFLRSRGCRLMQGFLYSRPLPADEITKLLAARNPKP